MLPHKLNCDCEFCKIERLKEINADLLEALESINTVLSIWLLDPGKAPNTLVASINAIIEPAIEKAR